MNLPLATLQSHLRYTAWASGRIAAAAGQLTPEELNRDHGTSEKSVLGTLVHIYAADRIWLARVEGKTPGTFLDPATDMHLSVIERDWPALLERWQAMAAGLGENDGDRVIDYRDLAGNAHRTPLWQIVLHVVNHGTHHRGQAAGMIRAMGKIPPPLDLIAYYRAHLLV